MSKNMQKPYILEKKLFGQIKQYMNEHPRLDVGDMTDYLMKTYKEYTKKDKKLFQKSVIKAYKYELQQMNINPETVKLHFTKTDYQIDAIKVEDENKVKKANGFKKEVSNGGESDSDEEKKKAKCAKRKRRRSENESIIDKDYFYLKFPKLKLQDLAYLKHSDKEKFYLSFLPKKINIVSGPRGCGKTSLVEAFAKAMDACFLLVDVAKILEDDRQSYEYVSIVYRLAESRQPCCILFNNIRGQDEEWNPNSCPLALKVIILDIVGFQEDLCKRTQKVHTFLEIQESDVLSSVYIRRYVDVLIPAMQFEQRTEVIKSLIPDNVRITDELVNVIAEETSAYVLGDLVGLIERIVKKLFMEKEKKHRSEHYTPSYNVLKMKEKCSRTKMEINEETIRDIFKVYKPATKREGFPSIPEVSFDDIGGMEDVKKLFTNAIRNQILLFDRTVPGLLKNKNRTETSGILMWGPPGCGKTLLAKAVANDTKVNFLSVSANELVSMYQGESERNIRRAFERCSKVKPCILFFDEIDCMCTTRTKKSQGGGSKHSIVNTFLAEMCGMKDRSGVLVVGTTNRPDMIDPAILRPGRFDTKLYIGLPDLECRIKIIEVNLKAVSHYLAEDVSIEEIAKLTENYSSADIYSLCRQVKCKTVEKICDAEALHFGKEESLSSQVFSNVTKDYSLLPKRLIFRSDFISALEQIKPSVSEADMKKYISLTKKIHSINIPKEDNSEVLAEETIVEETDAVLAEETIVEKTDPMETDEAEQMEY